MKNLVSKIWLPIAVATVTALHTVGSTPGFKADTSLLGVPMEEIVHSPDTVTYSRTGYKLRWTEEDYNMDVHQLSDTSGFGTWSEDTLAAGDSLGGADTVRVLTARDTIVVPAELALTDTFRYKYYVALIDPPTHAFVVDSLKAAGDSLDWPRIDSLYYADSLAKAKRLFEEWYASLDKLERKKYDAEQRAKAKLAATNAVQAHKDSVKAYKDSVSQSTPRILETFVLPDSLQYKRLVHWTHEREFHKVRVSELEDTSFNYRFNDYPFRRNDVNATWLGVAGSPVQTYNWFKRKSRDRVSFYEAQESWSWTVETMPMYNTKTPYTELGYFGTLFAGTEKESDNLHLLTTQNITPELNILLAYDRFGGGGILPDETTVNKNTLVGANYLGKRYMAHAGYIYNGVSRSENGGILDNSWIRDTVVNAREIAVSLSGASSKIKKNTFFLDQQYRIPFTFLNTLKDRKLDKEAEQDYRDSVALSRGTVDDELLKAYLEREREKRSLADTLDDSQITNAFIGHSTEYSSYKRWYTDQVSSSDREGDKFYNHLYYLNPKAANDSLRVSRLDNKFFIRLQPWSEDAVVSKLNVGIGDRLLSYYQFDPTFLKKGGNVNWNSAYVYAGAEGKLRSFVDWDAKGEFVFLGKEAADLSVDANLRVNLYPFRKARKSPVNIDLNFNTELDEPEFYQQHMISNHFKWDNEFSKISTTTIQGSISVPRWRIKAAAGYGLLANNIYYDTLGVVRQNTAPMSVLTATLDKEFVLGPLHLDNRLLFQHSTNEEVLPLPKLALNLKYYLQLNIQNGVLLMQLGVNGFYNTAWYSPAWNPALGVFHNQNEVKYSNGPYFDAFVNMQWKRACIFVKYENAGQGWPMEKRDYFSAHRYINTQSAIKIGVYWPFYTQPATGASSTSGSRDTGAGSN